MDVRFHSLLDSDPDLGQLLTPERLDRARHDLMVEQHVAERGPLPFRGAVARMHVGLLVVEGLIVRELALADCVSAELLGPGDVIRPWRDHPARLLEGEARMMVLEPATICVLDRRFVAAAGAYPEVTAMLLERLLERTHRVATEKAIAQLNGVDRRLLALFWELAERWGRVTPEGVVVPVSLPHRVVAHLIGARRPTVSTALTDLARTGRLARQSDGTWLLRGEPVGHPTGDASRAIRTRRFSPARATAVAAR
jgi:CRP-like cAMP-binding protein